MDKKELRKHFVHSLNRTLNSVISPTPYLLITGGDNVGVKFLDGKGRLPVPGSTEVTTLDFDLASLFFDDFHILREGVTGIGKTYGADALLNTVFGPEGYCSIRLNGGALGSSATDPWRAEPTKEQPFPKIDPEKLSQYGAVFIDEINRGEPNKVFQVVDGELKEGGKTYYLRIPIPGTDRFKGLAIIAAMNPPSSQYTGALDLDLAGENRFLKFKFPNGVAQAGSSQLKKKAATGELHDKFWKEFRENTGLKGGWKEIYPVVADPEQFSQDLDGETKEFLDVVLGYVGNNPQETYEANKELMEQGGVNPRFSIRKDSDLDKILKAQNALKHGFVRRDLKKISNLARLIGFIKGVKTGSYNTSVGLDDVAASLGIVLESKAITGSEHGDLMVLVNDARKAYKELTGQNKAEKLGLRETIWQAAVFAGKKIWF